MDISVEDAVAFTKALTEDTELDADRVRAIIRNWDLAISVAASAAEVCERFERMMDRLLDERDPLRPVKTKKKPAESEPTAAPKPTAETPRVAKKKAAKKK